VGLLEAQV